MGHIRLGNLPATRKWTQIVSLLEGGAGTPQLAAATLEASQKGFQEAAEDDGLQHSLWLLTQISLASRNPNFSSELQKAGLQVSDEPTLFEVIGAFNDSVDKKLRKSGTRTDVGEMAQMAASETISSLVGQEAASLFETTPADVQKAFKNYSTTKYFGVLAREFFSRFTQRYLSYFLSRELSNHVGGDGRFSGPQEHSEFNSALRQHCLEASKIVEEFSGGWFSKTKFKEGEISPEKAVGYAQFALKKLRDEMAKRGKPHDQ